MNTEVRNTFLTLIRKNPEEITPSERETLGTYVEGMVGLKNVYPLTTEDIQAIAAYIIGKN